MADAKDQDRAELARRSGSRRTRLSVFSPAAPTKWQPTTLRDPSTGEPFTDEGCWLFIEQAILRGEPIEEMVLKKPAGKRGFVMKLQGHEQGVIYVKLQLLAQHVLGRSFHISTGHDDDEDEGP